MSNKLIYTRDKNVHLKNDKASVQDTKVSVYVDGIDEPVYVGRNKVVVSGSAFGIAKYFNKSPRIWTPSYNDELSLDENHHTAYGNGAEGIRREEQVVLFAVGNTGVYKNSSNSGVQPVPYVGKIDANDLIPFRVENITRDISEDEKSMYFGRKTTDTKFIYYFKKPESISDPIQQYSDGTPIDENVYVNDRQLEVESFIRLTLKITKDDLRDYFEIAAVEKAVSSISILTGYETEYPDENNVTRTYYQNLRPLTLYHFGEESLKDPDKGLTILYDMFF